MEIAKPSAVAASTEMAEATERSAVAAGLNETGLVSDRVASAVAAATLSILIPVYNEADTLPALLERLAAVPFPAPVEIVVVDDGSTDGTRAILENAVAAGGNLRTIHLGLNQGKAAAIRSAMAEARGEIIVMQDADLELDPAELPGLMAPILRGEADVVYGSRFLGGFSGGSRTHRWGNRFLTWLTNRLYGCRLTDMETCYKMARAEVYKSFQIEGRHFELEPEITAKIVRGGWRIRELPVAYNPRNRSQGKKISWRDGLAAVRVLLRNRGR